MPTGYPIALPLDPDNPGPVMHAVGDTDERGRLRLPLKLAAAAGWLPTAKGAAVDVLVVVGNIGRISLLPWKTRGEEVLRRRRELIAAESEDAIEALRVLEHRYKHLKISYDLRVTLYRDLLFHLDLPEGIASSLLVSRIYDRIDLLSKSAYHLLLNKSIPALADLPE